MAKCIEVNISATDLTLLKTNNYKLCFAKKVDNEAYNVTWCAYDQYMIINRLSWEPRYNVFASTRCQDGKPVERATNEVEIAMGEMSTLSDMGILSRAVSGGKNSVLTICNEYGPIHFGICQLVTGLDGREGMSPIYVSAYASVKGIAELKPVDKVLVWFEQSSASGRIFLAAKSRAIQVDLTCTDGVRIAYVDGDWKII